MNLYVFIVSDVIKILLYGSLVTGLSYTVLMRSAHYSISHFRTKCSLS